MLLEKGERRLKLFISTFNNPLSYGAVLQEFALNTVLRDMGHEVFILDCTGKGNEKFSVDGRICNILGQKGSLARKYAKLICFLMLEKKGETIKAKKFEIFRKKYLNEISSLEEIDQAEVENCLLVCGSDQIWNPTITGEFQNEYFGINKKGIRAISYAASAGSLGTIKGRQDEFLSKVKNFYSVSVRESELNDYLNEHGIVSVQTIDPTLLFDIHSVDDMLEKISDNYEPYILFFYLGKRQDFVSYANIVSQRLGMKVVYFCGSNAIVDKGTNTFGDKSPEEFLNLFYHASYVITNSFHGLAFSLNFEKPFNVVLPQKRKERLVDLLNIVGLQERILNGANLCIDIDINYTQVKEKLAPYRNRSRRYLIDIVQKVQHEQI